MTDEYVPPVPLSIHNKLQIKEVSEHRLYIIEGLINGGHVPQDYDFSRLDDRQVYRHWIKFGYNENFRLRVDYHADTINQKCLKICGGKCKHDTEHPLHEGCRLDIDEIHKMLEDGPGQIFEEKRELFSDPKELEILLGDD